jgi:hypothetical protein
MKGPLSQSRLAQVDAYPDRQQIESVGRAQVRKVYRTLTALLVKMSGEGPGAFTILS